MTTRSTILALFAAVAAFPAAGRAADKPAAPAAPPPAPGEPVRAVVVDVVLAEFPWKAPEGGKGNARPQFTGPAAEVLTRVDELGRAGTVRRVRLNGVEGQTIGYSTGGAKPMLGTVGGGRPVQRSVNYVDVGLKVNVTSWVRADKGVVLDLVVGDAKVRQAGGADEAASVDSDSLTSRVYVPAGQAVAAQEVWTPGKEGLTASVIVVTARVADPAGAAAH